MPLIKESEISVGKNFPPERLADKNADMRKYANLLSGEFGSTLYTGMSATEIAEITLRTNWFSFIRSFWEEAIANEMPAIEAKDPNKQNVIDENLTWLHEAIRTAAGDMVSYGSAVFLNQKKARVQAISSRYWFPVREAFDVSEGDVDLVAYPYSRKEESRGALDSIIVYRYDSDGYSFSTYSLDGFVIGASLGETGEGKAGMPQEVILGDGFYGTSLFENITEWVREIHVRESTVSRVLDKQSAPHLVLHEDSYEVMTDNKVNISKDGMILPLFDGQIIPPTYLTWDAQLDAQDKAIKRAESRILTNARIAPILNSDDMKTSSVTSGAALRRLALPTVNAIREIRQEMNRAIKNVLSDQARLFYGTSLKTTDITITWPPALGSGLQDDAEAFMVAIQNGFMANETVQRMINGATFELEGDTDDRETE